MAGRLIYDNTLVADATSVTIDLSSTPIQKGELYEMVFLKTDTINNGTSIQLFFNNNQTATNYYTQYLRGNSSTTSAQRYNGPYFSRNNGLQSTISKMYIRLTNDGYCTYLISGTRGVSGSTIELAKNYGTSTFTATSITQIDIVALVTNAIGSGSRIQLYKVAKKVDEVEVTGSAVTSVQFTGLSIGKGNEYLLVSDLANGTINNFINLYANNNQTATNYYSQYIQASGTGVSGARVNDCKIGASDNTEIITKIKLTNDGYFNYQSQEITAKDSTIALRDINGTSTFTATSITQLDLVCQTASGIDVGSRFEIYKLI